MKLNLLVLKAVLLLSLTVLSFAKISIASEANKLANKLMRKLKMKSGFGRSKVRNNLRTSLKGKSGLFRVRDIQPGASAVEHDNEYIPDNLKLTAVIDFQILSFSSKPDNPDLYVPEGYNWVKNKKFTYTPDINKGAGGKYLYLLTKKIEIHKLKGEDKLINKIILQLHNNCGPNMKVLNYDLNEGSGGKYLYLCYGYEELITKTEPPIEHFYVRNTESKRVTSSDDTINLNGELRKSECNLTNLNLGNSGDHIYLCYVRNPKLPKKLEIKNLVVDYNNRITANDEPVAMQSDTINISNGNGSNGQDVVITRSLTTTEEKSKKYSLEVARQGVFSVKASVKILVLSVETENSRTDTESVTTNIKDTVKKVNMESLDATCSGDAGKYTKCYKVTKTKKYDVPYIYNKVFTDYSGEVISVPYKGQMKAFTGKETTFDKCCYSFCTTSDALCPGTQLSDKNACPYQTPVNTVVSIETLDIPLPDKYKKEVIIDVGFVWNSNSCNGGWIKDSQDIREGNGGEYVYLCFRTKMLGDIQPGEDIINYISPRWGLNCGDYKTAKGHNGAGANGGIEYTNGMPGLRVICFGNNKDLETGPITAVKIDSKKKEGWKYATVSASTDDGDAKWLLYKTDDTLPSTVELMNWSYSNFVEYEVKAPDVLDEIVVTGSKVVKTIEYVETKVKALNFNLKLGFAIKAERDTFNTDTYSANGGYGEEKTTTTEELKSTVITCEAPAGKTVKCIVSQSTRDFVADYSVERVFKKADKTEADKTTITGKTYTRGSLAINVSTCCVEGCCTGDDSNDKDKDYCWNVREKDNFKGTRKPKDVLCSAVDDCSSKQKPVEEKKLDIKSILVPHAEPSK